MYKIALKMLVGDRIKYYGLIFGIAFAAFLMSQQISIFIGAMKRTASQIGDVSEGDLWVMRPEVVYGDEIKALRQLDIETVRSIPGVLWAVNFLKGSSFIEDRASHVFKQVILIGVDDDSLVGRPPKMVLGRWQDLELPNSIIIDWVGWRILWGKQPYQLGRVIQLGGRRMIIVGICSSSVPFFSFPIVYTRYSNALNVTFPSEGKGPSFLLVKVKPPYSPENVAQDIEKQTGLTALTNKQFVWNTIKYYLVSTAIPVNFGITIALGFIIGAAIAGQTFYIFVIENLRQFASLKAMGVTNKQILSMVLIQAALVGFIGYGIGVGACALFFDLTHNVVSLWNLYLPWSVIIITGIAIIIIMLLASYFSIKKVLVLPPAEVFKG